MSLSPDTRARIEQILGANHVVLFMKGNPDMPQCGFSAKAAGILKGLVPSFGHVDVLSDPEIREGIKVFGQWPTIPQLYVGGELLGGSDIIEQMLNSGELHQVLGLPAPDRTPPQITITPAAATMLKQAIADAGDGYALQIDIDNGYNARLQLAQHDDAAIASEAAGIRAQFDLASAQRAPNDATYPNGQVIWASAPPDAPLGAPPLADGEVPPEDPSGGGAIYSYVISAQGQLAEEGIALIAPAQARRVGDGFGHAITMLV